MKKNSSTYMQISREQFRRATLQLHHKIQYTSLSDFNLIFYLKQFCKIHRVRNLQ